MREGLFLKKNIEKWKRYQAETPSDPDEMANRFTDLVNDLGYSKTFYPQSRVTQFLNGLASSIYLRIYENRKEESSRLVRFWKTELPLIVRKHHRVMFYSFAIFIFFAILGAFSAAHDESFVRGILGDRYVDMTEQNIAKGDPFGVYKNDSELNMFFSIALNNIQVAIKCFVFGLTLSILTVFALFQNGVMVGAFEYMFFARGLGMDSVLVIWIHGTLEISAIIISGGAGIILGNSILFPGTLKRIESLKQGAKDGVKIMIGLIPIFITAAFFEGFVTRYTTMPIWLSILILAGSAAFIIWYFVIYPIRLKKKMEVAS